MTRRVVDEPLDPESLVRGTADAESGALVVLSGPAAAADGSSAGEGSTEAGGGAVLGEAGGPEPAARALEELEEEVLDRFDVRRCRLQLRPDAPPDEPAIVAVVRAPHRRDAFEAARWAVASVRERVRPPLSRGGGSPGEIGPAEP